ncbi:siderophore-interacting protein [Alteromonas pelagimontana]|uniref:Siderophore-interacting protein n=1 Tax=Alteromonas pelagimontana TaxID=1858656 RepID=A0A6M4MES6_9ALTE|nr:siderophore-interacting protein [Alteromonas pelagimontana]QJR80676.1 siderophore-interacting protein [Alteromonas pelagimontana]
MNAFRKLVVTGLQALTPVNRPFRLTVQKTEALTPNIQRIVLGGSAMRKFPPVLPGSYINLQFNADGSPLQDAIEDYADCCSRSFSIRTVERKLKLLTLDIATLPTTSAPGPAARWAQSAKIGDTIVIKGPVAQKSFKTDYDWVLFAGDSTGMSAIANQLESLAPNTQGFAVIHVASLKDIMPVNKPPGVEIIWKSGPLETLAKSVMNLKLPQGKPAVWVGCEFSVMNQLKHYFTHQLKFETVNLHFFSHWQRDMSAQAKTNNATDPMRGFAVASA